MRIPFPCVALAALLLGTGCSKQAEPVPKATRSATANNVAPIDPGTGGGGGGGGGGTSCTPAAPSSTLMTQIKRKARLICADNNWTIITTTTPPDGFTFGLGCATTPYSYSVDVRVTNPDGTVRYTYASGTYDQSTGTATLSL